MSEDEIRRLATDWCALLRHTGQRIFEVIGMDDKFICTECSSSVFYSAAEAVKHVCAKAPRGQGGGQRIKNKNNVDPLHGRAV
jgi:hypothetical protein